MLFDDDLGFISYNLDNKTNKSSKLYSVEDGFSKGNMFQSIYEPYKNYSVKKVNCDNKKDKLLVDIMALSFAITDLGLYLDLHPNDKEMLKKYKDIVEESCKKEMEYVKVYGPLELIDNDKGNYFDWVKSPWPWEERKDGKYV